MRHVIILLETAYLEYRFFPHENQLREHMEYVRTVPYSEITLL